MTRLCCRSLINTADKSMETMRPADVCANQISGVRSKTMRDKLLAGVQWTYLRSPSRSLTITLRTL